MATTYTPTAATAATEVPWHRRRLAELGRSQRGLAERLQLDPSAVSQLFAGRRRLMAAEAAEIARYLQVPVIEVLKRFDVDVPAENTPRVRVNAVTAGGGEVLLQRDPVMEVPAPALGVVDRLEAIAIQDDSLSPRYRRGEVVFTETQPLGELQRLAGGDVMVQLACGRRYMGVLQPAPSGYNLVDYAMNMRTDLEVTAVSPVVEHYTAFATRRIVAGNMRSVDAT